jgi:DNA-binding transcriptional LysR family regulator
MEQDNLHELAVFSVVAEECSFSRASIRLGVSASAVSHAMRGLEKRLGLQLLARTTRSVAPTYAGEQLLSRLRPALDEISAALSIAGELRDRPAGRVRLVVSRLGGKMVVAPKLAMFERLYPDVQLDITTIDGPIDLIAGGFDAGIHIGDFIDRDMIAVRVSRDQRRAIVGSPEYFRLHSIPVAPNDLREHRCIAFRIGTSGVYRWDFRKGRRSVSVSVKGPVVLDDLEMTIRAALDGVGLALTFEDDVAALIGAGRLIRVLEDWCPPFPGFFLYFPSRKNQPAALKALVNALKLNIVSK